MEVSYSSFRLKAELIRCCWAVGKVEIAPLLRDFQAEWKSPAVGLFRGASFSTAVLPTNCAKDPIFLRICPIACYSTIGSLNRLPWLADRTDRLPCSFWIWIVSNTSTIHWDTASATSFFSLFQNDCWLACADPTRSAARAEMSSLSCSRRSPIRETRPPVRKK